MATKTIKLLTPRQADEAKYQPQIESVKAEMDRILKGLKRKQAKIHKLRYRTEARLAELKNFTR